jgi:hypothetical protein
MPSPTRSPIRSRSASPSKKSRESKSLLDETVKNIVEPIPKKEDYSLRFITYFLILVSFILVLTLCLVKRSEAEAFYSSFGSGFTFITSLWYMLPIFIITYAGIFFVVYTTNKISIWMVIVVLVFLIINVITNLMIYYFIPETAENFGTVRSKVTGAISIVPLAILAYLIYNNNSRPVISLIIIAALIVFSAFSINVNVN